MKIANPLTKREKEILAQLLQGQSNRQIAYSLQISIRTVEFHLTNIYAKFNVSSRVELILHLVNTAGQNSFAKHGVSTGDNRKQILDNRAKAKSLNRLFGKSSLPRKELAMKKRWPIYLLIGLFFGAVYFHYFGFVANILNQTYVGENSLILILLFGLAMVLYFGIWLLPGILPAIYELKRSSPTHHAILAVVLVCLSAVTGYYISYWIMLALVGVPNMEFLVIIGEPSATLQAAWAEWFPRLIGLKWLKWSSIGLFLSAGAAFATAKIFLRKHPDAQSA